MRKELTKQMCVSVGVRKYISSEPDCGREPSAAKGPVCKTHRLPVHCTETPGSAEWPGSSDGWHSLLERSQHLPGGSGNPDWTVWLVQVCTLMSFTGMAISLKEICRDVKHSTWVPNQF